MIEWEEKKRKLSESVQNQESDIDADQLDVIERI